jgi:hypothetical protein
VCIVIAGPNGAGKTTFAREFLPKDARVVHFVNADLIAGGLSPLRPELAAIAAGRLVLRELERLAGARLDFAFESTLSGLAYSVGCNVGKNPVTALQSSTYGFDHRDSRSAASPHGSSRAAILFRVQTCFADSREAGLISKDTTGL